MDDVANVKGDPATHFPIMKLGANFSLHYSGWSVSSLSRKVMSRASGLPGGGRHSNASCINDSSIPWNTVQPLKKKK